jgi:hypothetical protein
VRLVLTGAVVTALGLVSAASAGQSPTLDLPDFAYSVTLRDQWHKSAACVARGGDVRHGWRLAGLGSHQGTDWSPDGSRVVVAMERPNIGPIRVAASHLGGGFRAVSFPRPRMDQDSAPDWSPDGRRIAFARYVYFAPGVDYNRFGLWVADLELRRERQFSRRFPTQTAWSPDGGRLAARFDEGDLSLFAADGRLEWTISRGSESTGDVAWSPAGDVIAAGFGREILLITPDRHVVGTIVRPEGELVPYEQGVSWSPDGTRLAVGGGGIYSRTGELVGRYAPASTKAAVAYAPNWTSDGTTIVFARAGVVYVAWRYGAGFQRRNADLYAVSAAGGDATSLTSTPNVDEGQVVFRPARVGGTAGTAQECMLEGSAGRDVLYGSAAEDLVNAGPGADVVYGRGGDDVIFGGDGNDALFAGIGRDTLYGDRGNDRLYVRDKARDRVISGGPGRDQAWVDGRLDHSFGIERLYRR